MAPLTRALLALAAAALLRAASASHSHNHRDNPSRCTTAETGHPDDGFEEKLTDVYINKREEKKTIDIPYLCPQGTFLYGVKVIACDDKAPEVNLPPWPEYRPADVTRKGNFMRNDVVVHRYLYCNTFRKPADFGKVVAVRPNDRSSSDEPTNL